MPPLWMRYFVFRPSHFAQLTFGSRSKLLLGIKKVYDNVKTSTAVEGRDTVWFDWVDGYHKNENPDDRTEKFMFDIHRTSIEHFSSSS